MKCYNSRAFTILELMISMFLVALLMGPILNTFQVSEKLSRRGSKAFNAQNLAREMMGEIAKKSFDDPYQASTINVSLKPGPTHEEYLPDASAPKIANGTEEVGGVEKPRLLNETLVNRSKYYNDIDDYDGYNTDESILPTLANGGEYIADGENPYANLRVKVEVKSNVSGVQQPEEVLKNGATLGNDPKGLAITPDGKYAAVINAGEKTMSMINLQTGYEVDCGPNTPGLDFFCDTPCTGGVDRIPISSIKELPNESPVYNLGDPIKVILGPTGDRFYVLHGAGILDPDIYSGVTTIDMNPHNTPEVSFHKVFDTSLVSKDLRSNSINSIVVDKDGVVYAATNGGGLSRSDDNGGSWALQKLLLADGATVADTIYCLAAVKHGYGMGDAKYVYAGGKGGLWISKDNGPWNRVNVAGSANITAIAAMDNGYVIAGTDNGNVYVSREYDTGFVQKYGPVAQKINALAIDDNYRAWAGNDTRQFYSENAFHSSTVSWTPHMPTGVSAAKINSIYIDRSQTYPAPFTKVLNRDTTPVASNPACPSLHANASGLHLFYLDDSGEVGAGTSTAFNNPKLWYVNSPDFGKTWGVPRKLCNKTAGWNAWAHSEVIDRSGVIHVLWQDDRQFGNKWQLFYQKSEDGGKTWLPEGICIGNEDGAQIISGLNFHGSTSIPTANIPEWIRYGSDKFKRIAVSSDNHVYIAFSEYSGGSLHHLRYSADGGKTWPSQNKVTIPKTSGCNDELIESIDFIEPMKKLMIILITGNDSKSRKMLFADSEMKNIQTNSNFTVSGVVQSIPPAFNEENKFSYFTIQDITSSVGATNKNIIQYSSDLPYTSFSSKDIQRHLSAENPLSIFDFYKPVFMKNQIDLFSITSFNGGQENLLLRRKSNDFGITYFAPSFIDNILGNFDYATTTVYNSNCYLLKRTGDSSPGANFKISSIASNVFFSGSDNSLYCFDPGRNLSIVSNSYNLPDNPIKCITGDDSGNIIYGTSSGMFLRNVLKPNTQYWSTNYTTELIDLPPIYYSHLMWRKFFSGTTINSIHIEKHGVFWVGTADRGIFRTDDYGENWTHIESNFSGILDLKCIGSGTANRINKICFFSRRFNIKDQNSIATLTSELVASLYNLHNGRIESKTLLSQDNKDNLKSVATNSYDNSNYIYFDENPKQVSIKKIDRHFISEVKSIVQNVSSGANYQNDSYDFRTGFLVDSEDIIEMIAHRKYFNNVTGNYLNFSSLTYPSGFYYGLYPNSELIGILKLKIADISKINGQYYKGKAIDSGTIKYCIGRVENDSKGYCLVETKLSTPPFVVDTSSILNSNTAHFFSAPDNKTVFFTNYADSKVYSVSDINDTSSIQIKEYAQNLTNPFDVIFSPKNRDGEYKTYIVCTTNIVDLYGHKLLPDISGINISGAAFSDNGELYFVDKTTKKLYKCITSAQKTVYVTVKETDDSVAGAMPPVTLVRKFHNWQAANEIRRGYMPNRNYIKYNYVYTSKQYPTGISTTQSEIWSPQKSGTYDTLNAYIVDSVFAVNGTLEILAGTVVKFATADKLVNDTNWSGKANSCIKVGASGKLLISGGLKESERVVFTSLDDNTVIPSAYSADDLSPVSGEGLANPQLVRVKSGDTQPYCGVKYGDWGKSDGSEANSLGGIHLADAGCAVINSLETRYGLLYTKSIYPGNVMPPNFNTTAGINDWTRTNVYVINDTLEIGNQTRLNIGQGTIVKFHTNSALSFKNTNADNYPWYSVIADGSPRYPIPFAHVYYANATQQGTSGPGPEGSTPNVDTDGNWYGIKSAGRPDNASFKGVWFRSDAQSYLNLSDSEFKFTNCVFGNSTSVTNKYSISLDNYDSSRFHDCLFRTQQNAFKLQNNAVGLFSSSNFFYNISAGLNTDKIIYAGSNSVLLMKGNLIQHSGNSNLSLSKIDLRSHGYFSRNRFTGPATALMVNYNTSCEISVTSTAASPILPVIENNLFEKSKCAIYLRGTGYDTTSAILENRFVNNSFLNCNVILRTEISDKGDFPESPAGAAIDRDGNIYITDNHACAVYKYSPNGKLMMKFGGPGAGDGQFVAPAGIAVNDTGEIYVVDWSEKRVQKFDRNGKFILKFATDVADPGGSIAPSSITVSMPATTETLFVTDNLRDSVMRFDNVGNFQGEVMSSPLLTPATFSSPTGLVASRDSEYLYVTDTDNNRVVKIKINLTTTEIELGDDYFAIEPRVFNVNNDLAVWPLGFGPGAGVDEGGHIELNVVARNGDGTTNEVYTGSTRSGKIYIDPTVGEVTWEGTGITDSSAGAANNSASYDGTTFVNGVAKFYVRNTMAGADLNITVIDDTNTEMRGSAKVSWFVESTPPALEFVGANSKGFRRYTCKNDLSVTFIKIPASAFDRGDGTYGGSPTEIKMSTYYIAETLTTNAQFNNWRNSPGAPALLGAWASVSGLTTYANHPAICLQKEDARNYSYWLITGSNSGQNEMYHTSLEQHEKASRGAKLSGVGNNAAEKLWPWGNTWNTANCNENSVQTPDERIFIGVTGVPNGTTRVNRYPEMGYYGLRDITGNCWVWLRDNVNLVTGGSWYNGGLGSESYRCSFNNSHSTGYLGGKWDSVRPCFYWPVQ